MQCVCSVRNMGGRNSRHILVSQDQLDEYAQLTYLTKTEVMFHNRYLVNGKAAQLYIVRGVSLPTAIRILRKFEKLQPNNTDLVHFRHTIEDVCREFPELNYNPFRDQIFAVFSSQNDGRLSFEDFVDLSSVMSVNCPLRVKAAWAFRVFDFDADKQITRNDLCAIVDRLTLEPYIPNVDKLHISDVLLKEMDLDHTGGIGEMEFIHAITKMPEFGTTFSFRL